MKCQKTYAYALTYLFCICFAHENMKKTPKQGILSKLLTFSVQLPDDPISSRTVLGIHNFENGLRHSEKQRERKMIVISNKEKDISRNLSLMILMTGACARTKIRVMRSWCRSSACSKGSGQYAGSAGQCRARQAAWARARAKLLMHFFYLYLVPPFEWSSPNISVHILDFQVQLHLPSTLFNS